MNIKYIRPNSATWWIGVMQIVAGVFIASVPVHGLSAYAETVNTMTNNIGPSMLITLGAATITMRDAIGREK